MGQKVKEAEGVRATPAITEGLDIQEDLLPYFLTLQGFQPFPIPLPTPSSLFAKQHL